jgi:Putative peptidoglycan binding domain
VPRQIADDDEMPGRRRRPGAQAVAIEPEETRGLLMRVLLHSPKDMVAGALAAAAVVAIIVNALFLQAGRHPSPMFGSVITLPPPAVVPVVANPLPRPRPVEAAARSIELAPPEVKPAEPARIVEPRTSEAKASDPKSPDPKSHDAMTNLVVKSTSAPTAAPSNVVRPPAPIPTRAETTQTAASKRIAAVQRALTEYGYGQLKPTGTIGADTQAAIAKFERARKLPVTGQMSEHVVRELAAMIGHPVE